MPNQSNGFTEFVDCSKDTELFTRTTNSQLPTPFGAIAERTGIESRSLANTGITVERLIREGVAAIYDRLHIQGKDCAGLVAATSCLGSHNGELTRAVQVAAKQHGIPQAQGINYACSGFPAAVEAAQRMANPEHKHIVIVCAEILSELVDWSDENTAILFGDGLAATTIVPGGNHGITEAYATETADPKHCLSIRQKANTQLRDGSLQAQPRSVIEMTKQSGRQLYKAAPVDMLRLVRDTVGGLDGTDRIVPHGANGKFAQKMQRTLDREKYNIPVVSTVADQGNTAAASIPMALAKRMADFSPGEVIACPAKGAGVEFADGRLTEGVVVFRVGE